MIYFQLIHAPNNFQVTFDTSIMLFHHFLLSINVKTAGSEKSRKIENFK